MKTCKQCGKLQSTYNGEMIAGSICSCPTPPPVPSEIEGEINRLIIKNLDDGKLSITGKESLVSLKKDLTALLTHHTSEKVKEERELNLINKYVALNLLLASIRRDPKDYITDMSKPVLERKYSHEATIWNQALDEVKKFLDKSLATAQAAEGEGE